MTSCTLRLREPPRCPLDLAPLSPASLLGRSEAERAAVPLRLGNRMVPAGELFSFHPGPAEEGTLVLEGTTELCDRIGAGLAAGTIRVVGDAGAEVGLAMSGGRIEIEGRVGALAAAEAEGGFVRIRGSAGPRLAGALPGGGGARGVTVLVEGDCGPMAAQGMRRGLVIVSGGCGAHLGFGLRGGTVLVCGRCGPAAGTAMRRGSLLLLDPSSEPGATFADAGSHEFLWLAVLAGHLAGLGLPDLLPSRRARRFLGDLADLGKGEILVLA